MIPAIFDLPGAWTFARALAGLEATLDFIGLEQVSLLGHSFGGGLELGFAAMWPRPTIECVFGDTLGVKERFGLAEEALHNPLGILEMATPPAASAFIQSVVTHPLQLAQAAMWGFECDREPDIERVRAAESRAMCSGRTTTRSLPARTVESSPVFCTEFHRGVGPNGDP